MLSRSFASMTFGRLPVSLMSWDSMSSLESLTTGADGAGLVAANAPVSAMGADLAAKAPVSAIAWTDDVVPVLEATGAIVGAGFSDGAANDAVDEVDADEEFDEVEEADAALSEELGLVLAGTAFFGGSGGSTALVTFN
jgi:hypothetical protein